MKQFHWLLQQNRHEMLRVFHIGHVFWGLGQLYCLALWALANSTKSAAKGHEQYEINQSFNNVVLLHLFYQGAMI